MRFDQNLLTSLDLARFWQLVMKLNSRLLTEGLISPTYFSLDDKERKFRDTGKRGLGPVPHGHRFAFPKIDEARNAQGPHDFYSSP